MNRRILLSVIATLFLAGSLAILPVAGLPYYPLRIIALQNPYGIQMVEIDIKPGSFPNSINPKSKGTIPVAILSTADFDAPGQVDKTSLTFGRTGDEQSVAFCNKGGEDVNGDGRLDQVCHFETQKTGFQRGDTAGTLRGKTVDGVSIEGRDSVKVVPPK